MYAELIVDNMSGSTDRVYTYSVPEELESYMQKGKRVLVQFGMGDKLLEGVVIDLKENSGLNIEESKIKPVQYIVDKEPILSAEMLVLSEWMREKYLSKYIEVIKTVVPTGITMKSKKIIKLEKRIEDPNVDFEIGEYLNDKKKVYLSTLKNKFKGRNIQSIVNSLCQREYISIEESISQDTNKQFEKYVERVFKPEDAENIIETLSSRASKQIEIIRILVSRESLSKKELLQTVNTSDAAIKSLEKKGLVRTVEYERDRNPVSRKIDHYHKIELNESQRAVYEEIESGRDQKYLIHGVTGSGKTEVYLQLIESVLERGEDAIVLVPEISLTPQTLDRFMGRFKDRVAIYHSKLSNGERYDEWRKMRDGKVQIVVGTRSAIFSPFKNLGLIIIDEEHEQSYKSSMNPKYDTIEVAEKRCELEGAKLVLGSATPAINTYFRTENNEFRLLEMKYRATENSLPNISLIDMREELYNGNKSIFSRELYMAMGEKLERREQIILFLNSRGFSKFVSCRSCGYLVKCDRCDISMTYHAEEDRLICHYCGESRKLMKECPECKSKYIKHMGLGTQRVEAEARKHFPNARIARMDLDTTTRKHSYEEILQEMKDGEIDILIGTQMISKGLDFPNVTLVGVIIADTALNLPDYKSSERTFQLMTQVAGRAGRSELEGRVVIQTYDPEHYSLLTAKDHDYISFYRKEIMIRKLFRYPPFCEIIDITVYGVDESATNRVAEEVTEKLKAKLMKSESLKEVEILGPNPALIYRIKDRFRLKTVLKVNSEDMREIKDILRAMLNSSRVYSKAGVKLSVDINPSSII